MKHSKAVYYSVGAKVLKNIVQGSRGEVGRGIQID